MKQKRLLRAGFETNQLSDKELIDQLEELFIANCMINKDGKIVHYHNRSDFYRKLKTEMLERMSAASKGLHRNNHDVPKKERNL